MELFWFRPAEYERLYNCSYVHIDAIPLEQRQRPYVGAFILAWFLVYEILYIPCMFAMWKNLGHSSYKFMFYIGVTDVTCIWMAGFQTGYFAIRGYVFCSNPTLIYVSGAIGLALWASESFCAVLLALSRCIDMWSPSLGARLLKGNRTWLWTIPPTLYGVYFVMCTKPLLFSSLHAAWFFNPYVGYQPESVGEAYHNYQHTIHDTWVISSFVVLYTAYSITFVKKASGAQKQMAQGAAAQKAMFVQVLLIAVINGVASGIYVSMQYVAAGDAIIIIGHFLWFSSHGSPAIIYLALNRTMRRDVSKMFRRLLGKKESVVFVVTESKNAIK